MIIRGKTMLQMTRATFRELGKHSRATRKAEFLARKDGLRPWATLGLDTSLRISTLRQTQQLVRAVLPLRSDRPIFELDGPLIE